MRKCSYSVLRKAAYAPSLTMQDKQPINAVQSWELKNPQPTDAAKLRSLHHHNLHN